LRAEPLQRAGVYGRVWHRENVEDLKMRRTIGKLFAAAVLLVAFSVTCLYVGNQHAAAAVQAPPPENPLGQQFAADPGDGWMLLGGFLMIVALAIASAGGMLWARERGE
jgi:hypothetical protein